jgi:hypothetical protein
MKHQETENVSSVQWYEALSSGLQGTKVVVQIQEARAKIYRIEVVRGLKVYWIAGCP